MKIYPLHKLKQTILHKITPKRCRYILLEKTKDINISQYKKMTNNVPENADTFTLISIGKRDDIKYRKKITTFYNGKNIIERYIESSDGTKIIRKYENRGHDIKGSNCRYRKITQKRFNRETSAFLTELIEEMRTYKSSKTGNTKLEIIKNEISGDKIVANITEYPFNGSRKNCNLPRKILGLVLELDKYIPNITGTFETTNVRFPQNDKFLPFRFIIDDKLKLCALTKFFIKEKGLEKLGIRINITDNIAKNTAGEFSEIDNIISYNKRYISNGVGLAAHEVEHAYQYKQIGRIGKGYSQYGRNSMKYYGKIDGLKENMEAQKYSVASANYPKLTEDEDLTKNTDYMNNYLEIKARNAEVKAINEYNELGKELNKQFFFGL